LKLLSTTHTVTYSLRGIAFTTFVGNRVTEEIFFSICPTRSSALQWLAIGQEAQEGLVGLHIVAPSSIKA